MSTKWNPFTSGRILAVLLVPLWLLVCAAVWDDSTTSGGDRRVSASEIMAGVASGTKLKRACARYGEVLAEASIRSRLTELRPSALVMKSKEEAAYSQWRLSRCPDRALVGISYDVSHVVNAELADRRRRKESPIW